MERAVDRHQRNQQLRALQLSLYFQRNALRHAEGAHRGVGFPLLTATKMAEGEELPSAIVSARTAYAAIVSSAPRLRITRIEPSSRISSFFLRSLKRRVTVSRDAPIICAISSCVTPERIRTSLGPFASWPGVQDRSSRASLPADERAKIKSCMSRYAAWNSRLNNCVARNPNSPCFSMSRSKASRSTKFTWQGTAVSAVSSYGSPATTALSPRTAPASAIFSISTLPSRELVESFTLPEHKMETPRGVCPSTKSRAPLG